MKILMLKFSTNRGKWKILGETEILTRNILLSWQTLYHLSYLEEDSVYHANELLLQLLLYGNKDIPDSVNRHILELTLNFIHKTGRFD